jgi:hypothetical protein
MEDQMVNKPKIKGTQYETETVKLINGLGIECERVPLSGALGGKYRGDVQFAGLIVECKRRRKGFSSLYKALRQDNADLLFVRDDNEKTLAVLPWETFTLFLQWLDFKTKYPHQNAKGKNDES